MSAWKVINSKYLLKRWWMNLREDHVVLPNGAELTEFHVLEYPDWACTVCLTADNHLVMVEQYRHGIGRMSLELPAGAIDPAEDSLDAARRELREETGFTSDEWFLIGSCAPEPSKHTNRAHFFVALNARSAGEPRPDESESLHLVLVPVDTIYSRIENGEFIHGTQIAALFWAQQKGYIQIGCG